MTNLMSSSLNISTKNIPYGNTYYAVAENFKVRMSKLIETLL